MKILIVDDEPLARERLRDLVERSQAGEVVGEAGNGQQALELCQQQRPDVVLLDIRMPVMDGLETARHLSQHDQPPAVIFTTAYDEYALAAFDNHAVGYLVKPIRQERLTKAIANASRLTRAQLQAVAQGSPMTSMRSHIQARSGDKLHLIPLSSVCCLHAEHKYVTVVHEDGQVLIEESLKSLESELDESFLRIHRNALVNVHYLQSLEKDKGGQWQVHLRGLDKTLEVSRRHLPTVRQRIKALAG